MDGYKDQNPLEKEKKMEFQKAFDILQIESLLLGPWHREELPYNDVDGLQPHNR